MGFGRALIGGLGILLARKNTDDFRYRFENGQNWNIFVMNRVPCAT